MQIHLYPKYKGHVNKTKHDSFRSNSFRSNDSMDNETDENHSDSLEQFELDNGDSAYSVEDENVDGEQEIPIQYLDYVYQMLHYNIEQYDDYNWFDADDITKMSDTEFIDYHNRNRYIYSHEYDLMLQEEC